MSMSGEITQYQSILSEFSSLFDRLNDQDVNEFVDRLSLAQKIIVFGAGRERLQIMGFAMRLFHMGRNISVVGDMTTPPVGQGDVLLMTCGPGELSTVTALATKAKVAGAQVVMITAEPDGESIKLADFALLLPAQTMASDDAPQSLLPMGSIFEGALFILFEVIVLRLMDKLEIKADDMRGNHTNLE